MIPHYSGFHTEKKLRNRMLQVKNVVLHHYKSTRNLLNFQELNRGITYWVYSIKIFL